MKVAQLVIVYSFEFELYTWISVSSSAELRFWQMIQSPTSAENISVPAEWLRQSGRALSEPSETPRWRITVRPVSIQRVAFHIALWSLFHRFFSFCRSPILNDHSGIVANCDHTLEWVQWVRACIGIAMLWVTLRKSLLAFLLPARKMQFALY
jgi:hypothetical protein